MLARLFAAEEAQKVGEQERTEAVRRIALAPFRERIDALVKASMEPRRASGRMHAPTMNGLRSFALHHFMEEHALRHGELPRGQHALKWGSFPRDPERSSDVMMVDFDAAPKS